MKTRGGFTLVELMVAMGLLVLFAVGISGIFRREGNAGVALKLAQRELATALDPARRTAQARQASVRLRLPAGASGADRGWWLERYEAGQWVTLRETGTLPAGTRVRSDGAAMLPIEFRADGSVVGDVRRLAVTPAAVDHGPEAPVVGPAAARMVVILADGRIEEERP